MMIRKASTTALWLLAAVLTLTSVASAEVHDAARKALKEKGDAVITVEVVLSVKYSYGGNQQEQENKDEVFGVVIGDDGLVITSLSSVDPGATYERMMGSRTEDMSYTSTVKSIKYIMPNNDEIDATVVLRDRDLDMAFLRPIEKQDEPFSFIDLSKHAEADVMEPIFTIARMGKTAKRIAIGMTGEIQGVIEKPRKFYITDSEIVTGGPGVPVFRENGDLLGIVLLHVLPGAAKDDTNDDPVIPVVIPALDVEEVAAQAPEEAPKESAPAPEENEPAAEEDTGDM
ncbi:serine protease [bacterium]|nr:serine protease [bacterium]